MTLHARLALAVAAAAIASPLSAQTAPANNSAGDTIGPRELRNFSLGGPRVRPNPVEPGASSPGAASPPLRPAPRSNATRRSSVRRLHRGPAAPQLPPPTPAPEVIGNLASPIPSLPPIPPSPPIETAAPSPTKADVGIWPWLLAGGAAAIAAALAFVVARRLRRGSDAFEQLIERETAVAPALLPEPASAPLPAGIITVRRPDPFVDPTQPPIPSPAGIVSARLRPQLDFDFIPSEAIIDEARASVAFDIIVRNSGNAPARRVVVEAVMLNAGAGQDADLERFFASPVGAGDPIDAIPPLGSVALTSTVSLPLDQVQAYAVEGRRLFVPLVAFNALYQWGSGQGQSSASFIVGRGGEHAKTSGGARMAPLRLDLGPRVFRELEARANEHAARLPYSRRSEGPTQ